MTDQMMFLYTTWPDTETAKACVESAVSARLAAGANIFPPMTSHYHWKGKLETSCEIMVLFKTRAGRAGALRDHILAAHPYETPAIAALNIDVAGSNPEFLAWIRTETAQLNC